MVFVDNRDRRIVNVSGRIERVLGFADPGRRGDLRGDRRIHLLPPLIQQLDRCIALRHEGVGAIQLLLGELNLGLCWSRLACASSSVCWA